GRMRETKLSNDEHLPLLSSPDWSHCEGMIKAFADAWQRGPAPRIEDHLHEGVANRAALLIELVHVDLDYRLKAGEPARVESYLAAYPDLAADRRTVVELIAAEYGLRRRHQGGAAIEEYRQRFPQYLDDLIGQLTTVAMETPAFPGGETDTTEDVDRAVGPG